MAENKVTETGTEETTAQTQASKPKRVRKRKTEIDPQVSQQAFEVGHAMQTIQSTEPIEDAPRTTTGDAPSENTPVSHAPEEYAAAMAMESAPQQTAAATLLGSGCGNILKTARESQGLSIAEVCKQLRLSAKQIQAIEQDAFDQLPHKSIVRGFIRKYAKLLKIDVEPILLAYQNLSPDEKPLGISVKSNASESVIQAKHHYKVKPRRLLTPLLLILIFALAVYFYATHIKPHAISEATQPLNTSQVEVEVPVALPMTTAEPAPVMTEEVVAADNNNAPVAEAPVTAPAPPAAPEASAPLASATSEVTVISSPTPANDANKAATTVNALEAQHATLSFKAIEESWVRVEDAEGKKVFSQILSAGSEQTLKVKKPLQIIVGNAAVTRLSIDQQPYDLTQATRGRVARVQLK